jgi:hypothetical protein
MDERPQESAEPAHSVAPELHVAPPLRRDGADAPIRSVRDFVLQLVTITAGVLIALLLEGMVGWNNNRVLVNEARVMIRREINDNKKALDRHIETVGKRFDDLENTLKWVTERMQTGKSDLKVSVGFSASPLGTAAWETAARTGAIAHMDYAEIQGYAGLYSVQAVFMAQQLRTLERVTSAISLAGRVDEVTSKELELLHQDLLHLGGQLYMEREMALGLSSAYERILKE